MNISTLNGFVSRGATGPRSTRNQGLLATDGQQKLPVFPHMTVTPTGIKHASSNEAEEAGSLMRRSTLAVSAGRSPKKMKSFALSFAQRNTESRAYFQAEERLSDQRNGAPNRS